MEQFKNNLFLVLRLKQNIHYIQMVFLYTLPKAKGPKKWATPYNLNLDSFRLFY